MTYQIITDEDRLKEFINWLPELGPNEKFYLSLFARKKYCPELVHSNDRTQLKRFTSDKVRMIDKIRQLELPLGRWKIKDREAPQEALVLYIHPNPRDMKKATKMMGKKCWDLQDNNHFDLVAESMSCIQQSVGNKVWIDFDIDDKEVDISKVKDILPDCTYEVLQTRGGYHVLVNSKMVNEALKFIKGSYLDSLADRGLGPGDANYDKAVNLPRNWYLAMKETFNCDNIGDMMIPVPGCVQGGFTPKFIEI